MDSTLVTALVNSGGMGILAAILFYLHITSLKMFREEIRLERTQCHEDHEKIMEAVRSHIDAVNRALHPLHHHP